MACCCSGVEELPLLSGMTEEGVIFCASSSALAPSFSASSRGSASLENLGGRRRTWCVSAWKALPGWFWALTADGTEMCRGLPVTYGPLISPQLCGSVRVALIMAGGPVSRTPPLGGRPSSLGLSDRSSQLRFSQSAAVRWPALCSHVSSTQRQRVATATGCQRDKAFRPRCFEVSVRPNKEAA